MKPGPKTEQFVEPLRARTLSLDDMTVDMARVLSGDGANASQGVRACVRFCYDLYQRDRLTPGTQTAGPGVPVPPGALLPAGQPAGDPPRLAEPR